MANHPNRSRYQAHVEIHNQKDVYAVFLRTGRDPRNITLIATSKTKGNAIRQAREKYPRCKITKRY